MSRNAQAGGNFQSSTVGVCRERRWGKPLWFMLQYFTCATRSPITPKQDQSSRENPAVHKKQQSSIQHSQVCRNGTWCFSSQGIKIRFLKSCNILSKFRWMSVNLITYRHLNLSDEEQSFSLFSCYVICQVSTLFHLQKQNRSFFAQLLTYLSYFVGLLKLHMNLLSPSEWIERNVNLYWKLTLPTNQKPAVTGIIKANLF